MNNTNTCPCGQNFTFEECCGKYLKGGAYPQTAEQLMRSRYTAYTLGFVDYLSKTWHPDTRPELDKAELASTQWLRLEVLRHKAGLKKSIVEFKAYYQTESGEQCLHEVSEFKKVKNRWVYWQASHLSS